MSAAATAAGYLYASGRLRGREKREQEESAKRDEKPVRRRDVRVAVYETQAAEPQPKPARERKTPRIEYRTRRWRPDE